MSSVDFTAAAFLRLDLEGGESKLRDVRTIVQCDCGNVAFLPMSAPAVVTA